jgi:hypothetical protein
MLFGTSGGTKRKGKYDSGKIKGVSYCIEFGNSGE